MPSDVALKLGCGEELKAHSQVLKLASPFFNNLLTDTPPSQLFPVSMAVLPCACA